MPRSALNRVVIAPLVLSLATVGSCTAPISSPTSPQNRSAEMTTTETTKLRVVTTFLPVYLFTKAVAGDAAQVEILIPPGTEVHEYQSTPAAVQTIAQATILVKNGLGIEEFLDDTLKSAENRDLKVIDASQGIAPLKETSAVVQPTEQESDSHEHEDDGQDKQAAGHSHAEGNPHVWLDPVLAQKQIENIRDGLIAADPAHRATYAANAAAYLQKLTDLNQQFTQRLQPYRDRKFLTFHDAFPYLAKRYQLQQVAVVEIPDDQLAPQDLQKVMKTVEQFNVKAIFSEPGVDNRLVTNLSQDLRLTVYPLDSLEAGQLDPQYYFTVMQGNLKKLETAFQQ
ncbi:metal ABC transporter solute-binding protein, Zn/Mn family [Pantanalinema sp. GBBB05]|uniref:metal ABC transporter solute-binding protein, Zn/Mn family n=1 Tax=Pantanalinema sp. GBBB05 TaxID=2604139 RepID=UPI001D4F1FB6|nr:ABC transporter substrate-binding protein [Pantanalinema sp. GBBB05]